MNHQQLDEYLRQLDPIEKIQIKTGQNISDFDGNELLIEDESQIPRMQEDYFFDKGPIFINKHHRFADMPLHMHSFIEMNYVYSGTCKQFINGKELILNQGEVCILDLDVPHSIPALGKNDILVNIIMKKKTLSAAFLGQLGNEGIVSNFLANAISRNQRHDHYILFHSQDNKNLQYIIKNMMCEFFDEQDYSIKMIQFYMPVMFTELMRVYKFDKNFELAHTSEKTNIIELLQYIEQHYKDCSLTALAREFNFNPNYLGNMLKECTGKTFSKLVQMQRMVHASALLKNTNKSINDIAYEIGYESSSFFYRKFKQHFGCTPNQFRKNGKDLYQLS
ncbi:AraC family transcriptional regulator [Thermoactinomyces mirandus]|uniref:Helix-turn-helix domain-containing protein n=1 Tax=Thermoactinomyces mirandus TaxID=2756294 RepID=A0A7W1XQN8_9BACL|nr:helix-turn-helix domain-containing protein [Thermoactinomyces mirandus]MBA4601376.1 helix-turn-helix domain-containing protein [Thermoactinomyces mirandus]